MVIPPTAEALPAKNKEPPTAKTLPSYCITTEKKPYFGFTASVKKVPPTLDTAEKYRQLSMSPKEYRQLDAAQKVPPTLDTAEKVPPTLDIAEKVPAKRYRVHRIPPKKYRRLFSRLFFLLHGSSDSFSVEPLCGREDSETPRHLPIHLSTPLSTWSSTTMSGLEGNLSDTCSGMAWPATTRSVD